MNAPLTPPAGKPAKSALRRWSRRGFLAIGTLAGGGLLLGTAGAFLAPDRRRRHGPVELPGRIMTWLAIAPDDTVTILVPHAEMGQGVHTALAMMAADELDADWARVRITEAPGAPAFANGFIAQSFALNGAKVPTMLSRAMMTASGALAEVMDLQITGGSFSVRGTGETGMRSTGAAARAMLIAAAAARLNVSLDSLRASKGVINHDGSGRSLRYGELADDASRLTIPAAVTLKTPDQYTLMGTSLPRTDIPSKVNGSARYGIDTVQPDMLYASIAASPVFGTKLVSVDPQPAMARHGVVRVVQLDDAVAVVADSWWRAHQALLALKPVWETSAAASVDSQAIAARMAAILDDPGHTDLAQGDADGALASAAKTVTAAYTVPFLAHAPMEPPNATACLKDGKLEVWTGVQDPLTARRVAANAAGVSAGDVTIHNALLGGGFGRRLPDALDFVAQAARLATAMAPRPVKLIWSREEDIQHDFYRMPAASRLTGGLDAQGRLVAWQGVYAGSGDDEAARPVYDIANQRIRYGKPEHHVRLGYWRSVDHSFQAFFVESFMDELAHAAAADPLQFRIDHSSGRARALLSLLRERCGWSAPLAAGQGRGVAIAHSFGTYAAHMAEVTVAADGSLKVNRVVAAVDCGSTVNPDGAAAQVQGGIIFGLSAALWGAITIEKGAVAQTSFPDYRVAQLADAPAIDVHFLNSGYPRGGLGEPGLPPVAPAIANAIFAATGRRVRDLPLARADLRRA